MRQFVALQTRIINSMIMAYKDIGLLHNCQRISKTDIIRKENIQCHIQPDIKSLFFS